VRHFIWNFKYQALTQPKLLEALVSRFTVRRTRSGDLQMLKNVLNFRWLQVVFFAGCATGAVAGAIAGMGMGFGAGLLMAQKPGKELRDDLADKTLDLYDGVKHKATDLKDKVDNYVTSRRTQEGQFESNS
jgi:hypothetical protein